MRPTSRELLEGIDWALQHKVAPAVQGDAWAASTLRSVHCLLQHLAVRVEVEASMLHHDNTDLRTTLATVVRSLEGEPAVDDEVLAAARGTLSGIEGSDGVDGGTAGGDRWDAAAGTEPGGAGVPPSTTVPTVAELAAQNVALGEAVEALLAVLDRAPGTTGAAARADLEAYVRRRLEREAPLFAPAFLASTF